MLDSLPLGRASVLAFALCFVCFATANPETLLELDGDSAAIAFGADETDQVILQRTPAATLSTPALLRATSLTAGSIELQNATFAGQQPAANTDVETVIAALLSQVDALEEASGFAVRSSCAKVPQAGFYYFYRPGFTELRRLWCDEEGFALVATISPSSVAHADRGLVANITSPGFLVPGSFAGEKLSDAEIYAIARGDGRYRFSCGGLTRFMQNIPFDSTTNAHCASTTAFSDGDASLCLSGSCANAGDTGLSTAPHVQSGGHVTYASLEEGATGCVLNGVPGFGGELWAKVDPSPSTGCR